MANNEAGAYLNITSDFLKKLDSFDDKLTKIEKHAHTAADALKNGFGSVVVDATKLESAIASLANKIGALNTASAAVQNVGTAMGNTAQNAQQVVTATNTATQSLSSMAQATNQLSVSRPFESWNIAQLKSEIDNLNAALKSGKIDTGSGEQTLNKQMQQAIVDRRNALKEELKIQEASTAAQMSKIAQVAKAQNADTELHRRESEKRIKQTQKEYAEKAKLAQQTNYAKNTTVQGALDFSKTAHTLQRQVTAIEYLKKARLSLSDTDEKYRQKLEQINQAIARHNQALQQAGAQSQNIVRNQRNLLDISGQFQRQIALLFSVSQIEGYIKKIADVRGEFELTQRSLQAILQNKTQADKIFNQTVELAVKSPFRVKELASYAKQLAAYRIESDKLFDTTKRLADVSAGLGVDMQRLILAYGQVKAAAYLRGTEVRQFTEAGINLYGELQRYFQEVKGEAYTTAQIVDMISKRKVTFEDIENIFTRITDKGGLFYNMQEIQSETLQGKISNLKDSLDIMLNDIGKSNESFLKGSVDAVRFLLENWEKVVPVIKAAAVAFAFLGAQAILTSERLIEYAVMQNIIANGTKQLTMLNLLAIGWKRLAAGIHAVGAAFKASPYLLAFAAISYAAYEIHDAFSRTNEALEKNKSEYERNIQTVNALTAEYIQLSKAAKEAETAQKNGVAIDFDSTQNRKAREENIRKLASEYEKIGMNINLEGLSSLSDENLKKKQKELADGFTMIEKSILAMNNAYSKGATESEWYGILGDNISTDVKDLKKSEAEIQNASTKMQIRLDFLGAHYNELSDKAKEYYDTVKDGQNKMEGESEVEYLERVHDAISEIIKEDWGGKVVEELQESSLQLGVDWGKFHKDKQNFIDEVAKMKRDFEEQGITDPFAIFVAIDRVAAENEWTQYQTNIAKREFKVPLIFDPQKIDDELSSIGTQLREYFAGQSYTVNIDWSGRDATGGREDYENIGQEELKQLKSLITERERYNAVIKEGGVWKGRDIIAMAAEEEHLKKQLIGTGFRKEVTQLYSKGNNKTAAAKAERDIWAERISVLKEMQKQYEKVREHYGEDVAKSMTLSEYMDDLKYVKIGKVIKPEDIVPTKQGLVDALEKVLKAMPSSLKDYFKKSSELKKTISQLKLEIQTDEANKKLEKTKKNIEDMFNGLDLHQKLKDAGLSEAEVQALFPGLAKTLDEVEKGIRAQYDTLRDANGKLGETEQKDYDEYIRKLNEQRVKESQDLVVELTKAYKTQLSDQMQLDTWYAKERAKIYAKAYDEQSKTFKDVLTPEMQKEYEANLNREYQKRTSENTWKNFQATDSYISMFENMDKMSSEAIQRMLEKLESLRSSLKGLPADQVRAIINQMEKLREVQIERNPFKAAIDGIKELKEAREGLIRLDEKGESTGIVISEEEVRRLHEAADEAKVIAETKAQGENKTLQDLERQREERVMYSLPEEKNTDEYKKQLSDLNQKIEAQRKVVNLAITEAELQGKISKEYAEQLRLLVNAEGKLEKGIAGTFNNIATIANEVSSSITAIASDLENVFGTMSAGTKDTIDSISEIAGGIGQTAQGATQLTLGITSGKPIQMVTGGIQAIGGLAKTISSIFAIGDKKKEREIQRQIENVEKLQKAYDVLKEKMDAAWSSVTLHDTTKQTVANLNQQIQSYQAMIKAEQDKKKTDKNRIKEWQEAIEELEKTKQEIMQQEQMDLGGIGGESEYKSAAESFVQAWKDAFNETGDGLEGLKENFDDFIENLIVKQATMQLAQNRLQKLFDAIDKSVTEDSAGGINLTREELANINSIADSALKGLNEDLLALMETLGYKGTTAGKKTDLSALQQGIQGVTEQTAAALESMLNSIRFFVSQQTTDISAIRALLGARSSLEGGDTDSSNPMLTELKTQTAHLLALRNAFDSVLSYSANSKGRGLRVYIQ